MIVCENVDCCFLFVRCVKFVEFVFFACELRPSEFVRTGSPVSELPGAVRRVSVALGRIPWHFLGYLQFFAIVCDFCVIVISVS